MRLHYSRQGNAAAYDTVKISYITNARLPTEKAHGLQIMKTCEALARAGHEVELLAPRRRNHLSDDPFAYYGISAAFTLRRLFTIDIKGGRLAFLLQECSFAIAAALALTDRTRAIYGRDELVLMLLFLLGHRNLVWESHDGAWNRAARFIARRARAVAVVSRGLRDFYVERGIDAAKIAVIPNAIDTEQFAHAESKAAARTRLGLPLEEKIALYIGRLDGWKGVRTLLDASELLYTVRVVLIGDGADLELLRGTYPRATLLGPRPYSELADNQAAADVLVIPNTGASRISAEFTSPLKLFAHMASGVPIVASDLPSIREIVDEKTAILVAPDDANALADGIRRSLAEVGASKVRATEAQEISHRYNWSARAAAIGALLSTR